MLGHTAENAKTFMSLILANAFPIYCTKLSSDCFDKNNGSKFHKTMSSLTGLPIRLVYLNEWGENPQNTDLIKDFVDGNPIKIQPLYQEEQDLILQSKMEASSNYDPNVKYDNGINRRGDIINMTSKFTNDETLLEASNDDPSKHVYKKDESLANKFTTPEYALALFHYLAPYTNKYLSDGLDYPKEYKSSFADVVKQSDDWSGFFDEHIVEETNSVAFKQKIMEAVNDYFYNKGKRKTWRDVLREVKKRGMVYDSQKTGTINKVRMKGGVLDCKVVLSTMDDVLSE